MVRATVMTGPRPGGGYERQRVCDRRVVYRTQEGDQALATIKYSSAVALWTNFYGPENYYDSAFVVAVDAIGNVFVTGNSGNLLTIKYSSAGTGLWTNRYSPAISGGRWRWMPAETWW